MLNDPVVEEIRKIRKEIEKEYKKKGQTYYEHISESFMNKKMKTVSRKPRRISKAVIS